MLSIFGIKTIATQYCQLKIFYTEHLEFVEINLSFPFQYVPIQGGAPRNTNLRCLYKS